MASLIDDEIPQGAAALTGSRAFVMACRDGNTPALLSVMRRNFILGIVAALALVGAAIAGQPAAPTRIPLAVDTIIVPAGSPLKFKAFDKDEITATFSGRVTLSGTYHYGIDDTAGGSNLYLVLDPASRGLLPYWKNRPGNGSISIINEADFVHAVISPSMLEKLRAKKGGSLTGHISIVAENYQAAVVCDAPDYSVRFVGVAATSVVALNAEPAGIGC
jgi:hypothetical protein